MESNSKSLYTRAFFLFLLVSSNLLTYYLSSFKFCPFNLEDILHESSKNSTTQDGNSSDYDTASTDPENLPLEFILMTSPQKLPFGFSANFDSDTMHPPVGHPCILFKEDLDHYMTYDINGTCPDDELLAQKLLLKGCEPLPRRRCHPVVSPDYAQPFPLPESLWATPSDTSVVWTAYSCKDYECLINRKNQKAFDDCKDCFDLNGREKTRWINGGGLDFSIDDVLGTRSPGTVRIGLDIGGGTGTFAVRMKERNITIITTSMNLNGPFNSFIASRGVIPLYLSISQRLPLFDNTLDIVHSMHVMSNWIPTKVLHFLLYDIYRVLRPGGVFWLDHFFCIEEQLKVYVPLIESIGFDKVKWLVGRKLDRGPELGEMYISALLEKPLKRLS